MLSSPEVFLNTTIKAYIRPRSNSTLAIGLLRTPEYVEEELRA